MKTEKKEVNAIVLDVLQKGIPMIRGLRSSLSPYPGNRADTVQKTPRDGPKDP